jgi:hypothetical protein
MKRIDIIIPYIMGPDNGLELKYALRSIAKNFVYKNYRVIVVGDKPDWLTKAVHVPFARVAEQKCRNFNDQLLKLYSVLTTMEISAAFVWTYDDIYFTQAVLPEDIMQLKAVAGFDRYPNHLEGKGAGPNWMETFFYTLEAAKKAGGSNYNYETHLPRWFNKKKVIALFERFELLGKPMMLSTLYYNLHHSKEEPICLFDNNPGIRFLPRTTIDYDQTRKLMAHHRFTNNAPSSWNAVMKKVLEQMFPEKSGFEI